MKFRDALVAWNPGTSEVRVGLLIGEDEADWTRTPIKYRMTGGAAYKEVREATNPLAIAVFMFAEFHAIVVRDNVPVQAAHRAFLAIDEYRERIAPDIEGAT